jgi:hypothetical protein
MKIGGRFFYWMKRFRRIAIYPAPVHDPCHLPFPRRFNVRTSKSHTFAPLIFLSIFWNDTRIKIHCIVRRRYLPHNAATIFRHEKTPCRMKS